MIEHLFDPSALPPACTGDLIEQPPHGEKRKVSHCSNLEISDYRGKDPATRPDIAQTCSINVNLRQPFIYLFFSFQIIHAGFDIIDWGDAV